MTTSQPPDPALTPPDPALTPDPDLANSAAGDPPTRQWSPQEIAIGSEQELMAGRLPLQAQWRIAEQRARADAGEPGSFTSNLTVAEFAAISSVGFDAVGQVMGSAVYNVGWAYSGCGYWGAGFGGRGWASPGGLSGRGWSVPGGIAGPGGFAGPMRWQGAPVVAVPSTTDLLQQARHRAVNRMREECAGLGGDGVVGVRLSVRSFYGNGLEFMAMGTAVRGGGGRARPKRPFTSDLSGQDFAKLLRAGWVPAGLVQGVGVVARHNDWTQMTQQRSWYNQELAGTTELVHAARDAARHSMLGDAQRLGAHTVITREMHLKVSEIRCMSGGEGEDQVADAFIWGTAVVPFASRPGAPMRPPLMIMRLDRDGRSAR